MDTTPKNLTSAGMYNLLIGGPCRIAGAFDYMVCSGEQKDDVSEQVSIYLHLVI
jgi:hypothetical protein